MGLPQQSEASLQALANPKQAQPQPSQPPTSSTGPLPAAALELSDKLFAFARSGSTPELAQYITAGIPSNLTNHAGDSLLMLASYHGHAETVRMLLEMRADPDAINDRGQSPIAGAVFKGHDEVVRVLAEGGADLERGQPNAVEAARMFRREAALRLFGLEEEAEIVRAEGAGRT